MPERIGTYRLESPLGRGGMGEVFLAWDERLERPVAIKRIREDAFLQGHQRERFRREARLAARLSHASIVQVHDLVIEESGDAIVMEYVEGPTLAERLARGPLGTAEAVRLAREIAEGLAAAHEAGLIHRDLKAENVVVTPAGHAKILDFGLARPVSWDGEMLTQNGALIGTCYAMSPEQASGGELDERSDLFSFGALLYEMLTGRSAFRAKDPRATLQRVLYGQPQPLTEVRPDLPPALVSLVERLLAKDCEDRPRNALSVVHKLERIGRELPPEEWPERNDDSLSEMPTQAFPALPYRRSATAAPRSLSAAERPLRRARGWILFLGGALAALVIAVTAANLLARRHTEPAPPAGVQDERPPATVASGLDYTQYLEVRRRMDAGARDLKPDLEQLERIVQRSPLFLEARVLAAELALSMFESTKRLADLERARNHVRQARQLSPLDPRTLRVELLAALAAGQLDEASRILKQLEDSRPGDPDILLLRFRLEEGQGRFDEAEESLRRAVERNPSWRNVSWLASFELRRGKVPESRRHLKDLLRRTPDNVWVLEQLAYLELVYGDLELAEQIYGELAQSHPQRSYFTSLGQARSLRGLYKEAEEAYGRALEIDPGNMIVNLNLADTELDLGNRRSADALYGAVIQRLDDTRIGASLSPQEEMMKAQCLARLGREAEARESARNALARAPQDAQRLFEAALVHSVIGDRAAALAYAKDAVSRGMRPRWFRASGFDPLRQEPEFQALLESEEPEQGL